MALAMALHVRSLADGDRVRWAELRHALWPDAPFDDLLGEANAFALEAPRAAVYLAERDAAVCGFIELSLRDVAEGCETSPVPYVEGWYVTPEARRSGVGRALMRAAEEWARGKGSPVLASDAELVNLASVEAHQALGFEVTGRIVTMKKVL